MKTVKIAFFSEKKPDLMSIIISKFINRPYSHAALIVDYKQEREVLFHSTGKGVNIENLQGYLLTHNIEKEFLITIPTTQEYINGYIDGSLGKDYAQSQVFVNQIYKKLFKRPLYKNNKSRMICSELILDFLIGAGLDVRFKYPDIIDPAELDILLTEYSQRRR